MHSPLPLIDLFGPRREKTCLRWVANNKGADQPAHPRSLISAFVIPLLESIISKLATSEISIFWLDSVAEDTGLSLVFFSETPKTGFVASRPILPLPGRFGIITRNPNFANGINKPSSSSCVPIIPGSPRIVGILGSKSATGLESL